MPTCLGVFLTSFSSPKPFYLWIFPSHAARSLCPVHCISFHTSVSGHCYAADLELLHYPGSFYVLLKSCRSSQDSCYPLSAFLGGFKSINMLSFLHSTWALSSSCGTALLLFSLSIVMVRSVLVLVRSERDACLKFMALSWTIYLSLWYCVSNPKCRLWGIFPRCQLFYLCHPLFPVVPQHWVWYSICS